MPFVLTCLDKPNAGVIRVENRPAHLDHARRWGARVVTAGALLAEDDKTPAGSLFILDVPSRAWRKVFPEA
jgi:uncharacterized protein YciI